MYDAFSSDYDRFVDWPARLAVELPFLERQLQALGARRVLDAACGTGMHAIALAARGYDVAGADLSAPMIEVARANAVAADAPAAAGVHFEVAGFGDLRARLGGGFDAVLCLGNSLPHVLTPQALEEAVADMAACLRPGGLLLVQNRNFDAVLARRERWMEPQAHREGETEWLFLRFYDFEGDGTLTFNVVTLRREGGAGWRQQALATRLRPLLRADLIAALAPAGLGEPAVWGDMQGTPFDADASPNLIMAGRKRAG